MIADIISESNCEIFNARITKSDFISVDRSMIKKLYIAQSLPAPLPSNSEILRKAIESALDNSYWPNFLHFAELNKPVVLVIDDHTRGTPTSLALEVLYDRFHSIGVSDDQMKILVSTGTHRLMNKDEIIFKTGSVGKRLEIVQHDCNKFEDLFLAGNIDGIPILLNKMLKNAGIVLGVGSIVAHKFSGWSGGSKIICPGLTGYETIYLSHYKSIVEDRIFPGSRDSWFRRFIDRVAELAALKFCINFVPTIEGVVGVVAGEPQAMLARGILLAENAMTACFPEKADLVIVSSFPATTDLWQSGKGFYIGEILAKDGGTIILITPLEEGYGDHPDFISLLNHKPSEILDLLRGNKLPDPLAAVASYAIRQMNDRFNLRVVTSNASLYGQSFLGWPITGDISCVIHEAFPSGCEVASLLNDSYVLPRIANSI